MCLKIICVEKQRRSIVCTSYSCFCSGNNRICAFGPTISNGATNAALMSERGMTEDDIQGESRTTVHTHTHTM